MGTVVLRGISTALLVTVLTLLAGLLWNAMGFQVIGTANLVDIGLAASCLAGGYRAGKESGLWFLGGVAGAGYVAVGVIILALFAPVRTLGIMQVLAEGVILGAAAGVFGSSATQKRRGGFQQGNRSSAWSRPSSDYADDRYYANKVTDVILSNEDYDDPGVESYAVSKSGSEPPVGDVDKVKTETWKSGGDDLNAAFSWQNHSGIESGNERPANSGLDRGGREVGRPWWELD